MIGAVTASGKFYQQQYTHSIKQPQVVQFLHHLKHCIPGKQLLIWDGAPIHRNGLVAAYLRSDAGKHLHLELLPSYAPEMNAAEGIWKLLKCDELANVCCSDIQQLQREIRTATRRLQRRTDLIQACFKELDFF